MQSDPLVELADLLQRPKGTGVEARSAVLDGRVRYDIIRGKDLLRWMRDNKDKVSMPFIRARTPEEMTIELAELMMRQNFLVRCERRFKKPPPGMERLAKFPKKVVSVSGPDRYKFDESSFYAWKWERPMSTMTYVLAGLAAISVILICLFPVAPFWFKAGVLYVATGLLTGITALLTLRGFMAIVSYIATGRTVWVLPNLLAEDKPISELFRPIVGVQEPPPLTSKGAWMKHIGMRALVGVLLGIFTLVLMRNAPDRASVKREAGRYRDEIFDWLISDRKMIGSHQKGSSHRFESNSKDHKSSREDSSSMEGNVESSEAPEETSNEEL